MTGGGDRLLDAGEVAALLHVPVRWVRDATREGRIPHVRLGRYRRYRRADVEAWLDQQTASARAPAARRRGVSAA